MRAWAMLLSWLGAGLLSFVVMPLVMNPQGAGAMQNLSKMPAKKETVPFADREFDDADEGDDEAAADEAEEAFSSGPKGKQKVVQKARNKKSKSKSKNKKQAIKEKAREKARQKAKARQEAQEKARQRAKARQEAREKAKAERAAQKRKELKNSFSEAEEFHKTWFNMPFPKIKASLEKLTNFCKGACTKGQCGDEEVANNCHLMCPESTTKNCADPLKQADHESLEPEEFVQDDGDASASMADPVDTPSSLEQADAALGDDASEEEDGEEG